MVLKLFSHGMIGVFAAGLGLTAWSSAGLLMGL